MQFADVLCYIFLTITVAASCVEADGPTNEIDESEPEKRISKREATLILDNFPMDRIFQKPKVIYRRISNQRYGPPNSKYGPPKSKYRPPKVTRKPGKKPQKGKSKPLSSKYGPVKPIPNKKQAYNQKSRYGAPKMRRGRPGFGHVVKMPHYSFFVPDETAGFGEPPMEYVPSNYKVPNSYGEPPVDSYGAPVRSTIKDPTPQSFQETTHPTDSNNYNREEAQSWNNKHNENPDTAYAYSKKQPIYSVPESPIFVTPAPSEYEEPKDHDLREKQIMQDNKFFFRKKRPQYFTDNSKVVNRPWRANKPAIDLEDEIIVGGQYAEPPARFVAKFNPSAMVYGDNNGVFSPLSGYVDSVVSASTNNNSPYSNYKNSNMAFSPQNLNDAFSIVEK